MEHGKGVRKIQAARGQQAWRRAKYGLEEEDQGLGGTLRDLIDYQIFHHLKVKQEVFDRPE